MQNNGLYRGTIYEEGRGVHLTQVRPIDSPDRERLSSLLGGLPDPAWMIDAGGRLLDFNAAFVGFLRAMQREARHGISFSELMAATGQEELWRELMQRVRAGRSVMVDARVRAAGIERVYTIYATPMQSAAFFVAREVTTPHALRDDSLELALMRRFISEPTLDAALTSAVEFLCASDEWDGAVAWLIEGDALVARAIWLHESLPHADQLRAKTETLRFPRGRGLPGRAWASGDLIWVPDLYDESGLARADHAARSGVHTVVAIPIVESDQVLGIIEVLDRAVRPISSLRKQSLRRVAAAIGRLVERRRADDERRRLVALVERKGNEWALTFDAIQQPIFVTDQDGAIVRLNRAARDLAAASSYAEILGRTIGSLGDTDPWITLQNLVTVVAESGESCPAHIDSGGVIFDAEAAPAAEEQRIIVTLRDTTEVVRLQDAVRRGEQLAALGELVAGVAHQVKNPLFGIGMTADLLQQQVEPRPETDELFSALRSWLHRLDRLMESLLAYGKTWTVDLRPHGIREVIEQAIDVCRPGADANAIAIDFQASGNATLLMDPQRFVHAFENLITNAIQHAPRKSVVAITMTADGDAADVVIADRGPGFLEEDLPRVFEPFFTRRRGGTGLGLSIVQRIVDEHGGIVTAENQKSGGAAVRVRIPVYDERKGAADHTSHPDRG